MMQLKYVPVTHNISFTRYVLQVYVDDVIIYEYFASRGKHLLDFKKEYYDRWKFYIIDNWYNIITWARFSIHYFTFQIIYKIDQILEQKDAKCKISFVIYILNLKWHTHQK